MKINWCTSIWSEVGHFPIIKIYIFRNLIQYGLTRDIRKFKSGTKFIKASNIVVCNVSFIGIGYLRWNMKQVGHLFVLHCAWVECIWGYTFKVPFCTPWVFHVGWLLRGLPSTYHFLFPVSCKYLTTGYNTSFLTKEIFM